MPKLLLPLAGPEEFDDEDNEKLPIDLNIWEKKKLANPTQISGKCFWKPSLKYYVVFELNTLTKLTIKIRHYDSQNLLVVQYQIWSRIFEIQKHLRHLARVAQMGERRKCYRSLGTFG